MQKKSPSKKAKKPIGFLIFVLILLIGIVGVQMSHLYVRNGEIEREAAQLEMQKEKEEAILEELKDYKVFMNSTQYIEQLARERFGLVKPNETLFVTQPE
ncbi:MAG: septum formation initiator family protein [Vallitaleaceae bacterium]|nr:septum formation initiator family protein [Vallitaleaceae bacterium]